ncbi:gephyrin-like molybdotransferase Glp [Ancylobacter pratisalsi]|uniref:Molybdopterin molybdenumtransferase n=1 Tax=Ancylobacter pratisalsi TaxID=1745854 RepID=A0A6P1YQP1_9HYPH|nr:gephyrin-like molybdotransferase Glp [Ancylobacter pratisalsi]QIB35689.1 molybdopterin molybdotransferase MoeA [Ancylobacter pratisalsi]
MQALMPVEEALRRLLSAARPLGIENVALDAADGRVLAAPVVARRTTPGADVSAMDGYAVRAGDASAMAALELIGESAAGRPFIGRVEPGTTVRVFTGAVMPEGADAVVIQEDTQREGETITLTQAATPGRHIRRAGGDFATGDLLIAAGHRLRARDLALAASADIAELAVFRRPRVGLLSTGDELVRPGTGAGSHNVILSNIYSLGALARRAGAEVMDLGVLPDSMEATQRGVHDALAGGLDVLVTTGGASVGDHDLVAPALTSQGVELAVHKIALRPGKPLMFGLAPKRDTAGGDTRADDTRAHVLGLPGNPVSAHVCALVFLVPLLRALQGETVPTQPVLKPARLGADVKANDHRMDFIRATLAGDHEGVPIVRPLPVQDSSMLSVLARADVLLVRHPNAPAAAEGEPCVFLALED